MGSPPGPISSEESAGELPEFLAGKGRGQNVIVFNEIDKAHPDMANILMEMLDTGKLKARNGKSYPLGKSLVIFTTNKGDEAIYPRGRIKPLPRKDIEERLAKIGDREVRGYFMRPNANDLNDKSKVLPASFLNRIDAAVAAAPPSREGAVKIAIQEAGRISENLRQKYGFTIELSPEVAEALVDSGYVPEDGVRDLNREVEETINHPLLRATLSGVETSPVAERSVTLSSPSPPNRISNPLVGPEARAKLASLEDRLENHVFGQPEAVKATAKELFEDEERHISFDMGKIKSQAELNEIFGVSPGYVGSGNRSPFEQFLNTYPDGGVITFDEIGNMGGPKGEGRESLLKYFYSMLDEGEWRSPQGRKYDLRKYVIRFTSNEGQELFSDAPSDDLRMAIWKAAAKKENVTGLLKKSGWPEALIARLQGNVTLYRPSTTETREKIAKKMVDHTLRELKEQHGFKDFQVDEKLYKTMGESFFSHSEGARSMWPVSSTELVDLFSQALFDDIPPEDVKAATFHASLNDNYEGKHAFKGKTPPEREVKITLRMEVPGKPARTYEQNLADVVPEKRLVHQKEAVRIALHEAGHAVARLARVLAGGIVEERLHVGGRTSGWRSDKEKALKLPQKNGQVTIEHPRTQKEIQVILEEAEKFAQERIDKNIGAIRLTAARLVKNGFLSKEGFDAVIAEAKKPGFLGNRRIGARCGEYFRAVTK